MGRALSVSRAEVGPSNQAAYLELLGQLAARLRSRGQSLWLFRHPTLHDTFLEFSESPTREQHRSLAAREADEADLEVRLQRLAAYAPDSWILWEEVPLGKR